MLIVERSFNSELRFRELMPSHSCEPFGARYPEYREPLVKISPTDPQLDSRSADIQIQAAYDAHAQFPNGQPLLNREVLAIQRAQDIPKSPDPTMSSYLQWSL
jgi:hypothetical protein